MRAALIASAGLVLLAGADGGSTLDIIGLLREFGFPIFVCMWFMWRLEKRIDRFTESIEKLTGINVTLVKTIDNLDPSNQPAPLPPPPTNQPKLP